MIKKRKYLIITQLLIPLSAVLFLNNCEFLNEPFDVPANEYTENYYLEPGDTLSLAVSNIVDDSVISMNIVDDYSEIIDVNTDDTDTLFIIGIDEGETILQIEGNTKDHQFTLYIELMVITGQPILLKMGESQGYSPTELFNLDGQYPDSIIIEYISESDPSIIPIIDYIPNDTLLITGSYPGDCILMLNGYFGEETISLRMSIFTDIRHVVLGELFTSTTCTNCPEANETVTEYLDTYSESLAIIRYHLGTPAPGDPMYDYNMTDADNRLDLYIPFPIAPFFTVDGFGPYVGVGPIENDAGTKIVERIETPSSIYIGHEVAEDDSIYVTAFIWSEEDLSQYTLHSVLVENEVFYEGSNGEAHHYQVMRDMTHCSLLNTEKYYTLTLVKPDWYSEEDFSVITFLQNCETKEVIQANINHKLF